MLYQKMKKYLFNNRHVAILTEMRPDFGLITV